MPTLTGTRLFEWHLLFGVKALLLVKRRDRRRGLVILVVNAWARKKVNKTRTIVATVMLSQKVTK